MITALEEHYQKIRITISSRFNWHDKLVQISPIVSGNAEVFQIKYKTQQYVAKFYSDSFLSLEVISNQLDFLKFLENHEMLACSPIPDPAGNLFDIQEGRIWTLLNLAPGNSLFQFSENNVEKLGEVLAKIHLRSLSYPNLSSYPRMNLESLLSHPMYYISRELERLDIDKTQLESTYTKLKEEFNNLPLESILLGIYHGDPHFSNMNIDGAGYPILYDFDHSRYGPLVFDLAFIKLLNKSKGNLGKNFFEACLQGYQRYNQLSELDFKLIPSLMATFHLFAMGHHCKYKGGKYPCINQ